jgi:ketosteroid isomerase-like protein
LKIKGKFVSILLFSIGGRERLERPANARLSALKLIENMRYLFIHLLLGGIMSCQMMVGDHRGGMALAGEGRRDSAVVEIRSYTLRPGTRDSFHRLVLDYSLPMLERWKISVLGYGPSLQEDSSYYLVRAYSSLGTRQKTEDAFYGSDEWKKGPRESIVSRIINYTTVIVPLDTLLVLAEKAKAMIQTDARTSDKAMLSDRAMLSALNRQFIDNFIHEDAARHDQLIHRDFVCIQGNGAIVGRAEYIKGWADSYSKNGYTSFAITDEVIRIFGHTALVRSKTVYTKTVAGKEVSGNSIYTDTYLKEDGGWKCVQAQITPVLQ